MLKQIIMGFYITFLGFVLIAQGQDKKQDAQDKKQEPKVQKANLSISHKLEQKECESYKKGEVCAEDHWQLCFQDKKVEEKELKGTLEKWATGNKDSKLCLTIVAEKSTPYHLPQKVIYIASIAFVGITNIPDFEFTCEKKNIAFSFPQEPPRKEPHKISDFLDSSEIRVYLAWDTEKKSLKRSIESSTGGTPFSGKDKNSMRGTLCDSDENLLKTLQTEFEKVSKQKPKNLQLVIDSKEDVPWSDFLNTYEICQKLKIGIAVTPSIELLRKDLRDKEPRIFFPEDQKKK